MAPPIAAGTTLLATAVSPTKAPVSASVPVQSPAAPPVPPDAPLAPPTPSAPPLPPVVPPPVPLEPPAPLVPAVPLVPAAPLVPPAPAMPLVPPLPPLFAVTLPQPIVRTAVKDPKIAMRNIRRKGSQTSRFSTTISKCRGRGLNPQAAFAAADFKLGVSGCTECRPAFLPRYTRTPSARSAPSGTPLVRGWYAPAFRLIGCRRRSS